MRDNVADKINEGTAGADHVGSGGTDKGTAPRLPLPHDRDEAADQQRKEIEPVIEQAQKDIARGLTDTDRRGDAAQKFDDKFGPRREHGTPQTKDQVRSDGTE